jgi:transcriptional regulator with XRE-family HTH domain
MAARKTPAEKGPLGWWATATRESLGVSTEQVAHAAGISDSTYRKIEGGSNREPSRRAVRDIYRYFLRLGREQGEPIEEPPGYDVTAAELPSGAAANGDAVAAAILEAARITAEATDRNTAQMKEHADAIDRQTGALETAIRFVGTAFEGQRGMFSDVLTEIVTQRAGMPAMLGAWAAEIRSQQRQRTSARRLHGPEAPAVRRTSSSSPPRPRAGAGKA